jgi:uncharacterized coiled-coil DUF342 family protein
MNPVVIAAIVGALLAPIGAYLLAAKKMSGRISTTDADQLWEEAGEIRKDYRDQISSLRREIDELRKFVSSQQDVIASLRTTNAELLNRLQDQRPT